MLDVALINVISAGIAQLCRPRTGAKNDTPMSSETLIQELIKAAPEPTNKLISQCAANIWQACRAIELPASHAGPHLEALPAIIAGADVDPASRAIFFDPEPAIPANAIPELSAHMVANFGPPPTTELDETVLTYLLETFLTSLGDARELLITIEPHAQRLLTFKPEQKPEPKPEPKPELEAKSEPSSEPKPEPKAEIEVEPEPTPVPKNGSRSASEAEPNPKPETTQTEHKEPTTPATPPPVKPTSASLALAKAKRAEELGITAPLLDLITVIIINRHKSADFPEADLLEIAENTRSLLIGLKRLINRAPDHVDQLTKALRLFRAARFSDCNRQLAGLEDQIVRRSIEVAPHNVNFANLAIEIRARRAAMHALVGANNRAARYYSLAQRYIPRAKIELRWQFAELEAHYYELAAYFDGAKDGLENAARACSGALATMPPNQPSSFRADAQTSLAGYLILLGEKEQNASRFEIAAQLLGDAATFYNTQPETIEHVRSTMLHATALTRLGQLHQDRKLIELAAELHQSTIAIHEALPGSSHPDLNTLRARLALTLVGFAELEANEQLFNTAIATIVDELPKLIALDVPRGRPDFSRRLLIAQCNQALANWQAAKGEQAASAEYHAQALAQYAAIGFEELARSIIPSPQISIELKSNTATAA